MKGKGLLGPFGRPILADSDDSAKKKDSSGDDDAEEGPAIVTKDYTPI